ncbi:MAG: alanyl-tRNA editing protein [Polyangiales bacterium]
MTRRLYHDDPLLLDFEAAVAAHGRFAGAPSIVLDATAFYPESGGQLGDTGALAGLDVTDVQVDDAGLVHHLVAEGSALPDVGATVRGAVDRGRRRLHMAMHTGQHMLSRALLDEAGAETVSSRLGATACTVDVNLAALDEAALARAEDLVNRVVEDDLPVRAFFPTPDELAALPLRRRPKVTENVRVVDAGGFDVSPCGGTHCTRTSQVGTVTVTGVERYKGKIRVSFLAGRAAREELTTRSRAIADLAREFTCGAAGVRAAVERLRADLHAARADLGATRAQWAEATARPLLDAARARGDTRVALELRDAPVEALRALAAAITAHPGAVAMLASRGEAGLQVVLARGEGAELDCGAWLKRAAQAHGGRGGGRADRAEGRLETVTPWESVARDTA